MKAYIVKIELQHTEPLIWRRIIMPAGATYNRLHEVIQAVTNFQPDYHLYRFDLPETNQVVTNNEEAYHEHQHYKKNKAKYDKHLEEMPPKFREFEKRHQERLKTEVRKPTGLKIDNYLEKYKQIDYLYDFGDDWLFTIKLEEVVDDYYFGYPTLLAGAETAPPEDVGGIPGFYEFLKAYQNPKHPEHESMKQWAKSQYFREYDPTRINQWLKTVSYKKTEWGKIKHENYLVLEDKYRKN
ncbi:plasmid pRiA4b ORF-3 family protein [Jeotgalibaca sp. A122]|uniref:plasmid pRiA4b ORF-3 family protein n=1 Tax=Jeotgalibaca sp. A122 TaxID=3457322 RepID=UPI003FD31B28